MQFMLGQREGLFPFKLKVTAGVGLRDTGINGGFCHGVAVWINARREWQQIVNAAVSAAAAAAAGVDCDASLASLTDEY